MSQQKLEASFARIATPAIKRDDLLEHVALCHELSRPFEAYRAWRLWCGQNPADEFGWSNAAVVAMNGQFHDEAVICAIELLKLKPGDETVLFALSLIMASATFASNLDQERITSVSGSYTERLRQDPKLRQIPEFSRTQHSGPKIKRRIGYFWDFFGRSTEFCFPFHHDRDRFEVVAVTPTTSPRSAEQIGVDFFIEYPQDDLLGAVRTIRAAEIDILIDLNGRGGSNYSDLVMEARAAPIQAIFGNFFSSTFSPSIDALIGDRAILEIIAAHKHTEKLVPMADSCMVVRNPFHSSHNEKKNIPQRKYKYRFGTPGNHLKINPAFVKFLARIMKQIPDSSFFCYSLPYPEKGDYYNFLFDKEGIPIDRVAFLDDTSVDYFSMINEIDFAIDSLPYNGHLSTYEFLAQGTPVWSVRGPRMTERYGHMLIGHVGMSDWVFESQEELIASLVKNIQIKTPEAAAHLRQRVSDSALGDPARATRLIEDAIETLIQQTR